MVGEVVENENLDKEVGLSSADFHKEVALDVVRIEAGVDIVVGLHMAVALRIAVEGAHNLGVEGEGLSSQELEGKDRGCLEEGMEVAGCSWEKRDIVVGDDHHCRNSMTSCLFVVE